MDEHIHQWATSDKPNILICKNKNCKTVADLSTVLHNTSVEAAETAKVELLVAQLYAKDLKKTAHDNAYAYVISKNQPIVVATSQQESFQL